MCAVWDGSDGHECDDVSHVRNENRSRTGNEDLDCSAVSVGLRDRIHAVVPISEIHDRDVRYRDSDRHRSFGSAQNEASPKACRAAADLASGTV